MHDVANTNPDVVAPTEENVAGILGEEVAPNREAGNAENPMDHLGAMDPGADPEDDSLLPGVVAIGADPSVATELTTSASVHSSGAA